ncbi:MAG: hypothetical protein ABIU54_10160 [Candidatus Eisenbacteria bacterium]
MTEPARRRFPLRLLAGFAFLVFAVAVVFALRGSLQSSGARAKPLAAIGGEATEEDGMARAERLAALDSSEKTAWLDEVPGVDVSMFTPARREVFVRFANAQSCTCGCGFTLAACRRYDSECEVSLPRLERLRDSVAAGLLAHANGLRKRPVLHR